MIVHLLDVGIPTRGGNMMPLWLFLPMFVVVLAWTLWRRRRRGK